MIKGIGVDLVEIQRMERWALQPGLLKRFFHPEELTQITGTQGVSPASLAARFAAKEALGKALGKGLLGLKLAEIQVYRDPHGKPELRVHGQTARVLDNAGVKKIFLSLSHEKSLATAFVVLEGENV